MSNPPVETGSLTPALVSPLSIDYFQGAVPPSGPLPAQETDDYLLERASISSVLIARTADAVVRPTDSSLGYSFKHRAPTKIRSMGGLQSWIQDECHGALDELIASEPHLQALANRYQDLVVPQRPLGQTSRPQTRRETLMFQQAVSEPHAWLRIASIAASYRGLRIARSQALPFLTDKLKVMQLSARRDMSQQTVRSAVLEAADVLGTMLTPDDEEAAQRYAILSSFVLARAGHALQGGSFGELHEVTPDSERGVVLSERPQGFGPISPSRKVPIACPASYRFASHPEVFLGDKSALFRLLRAGVTTMKEKELFGESLAIRRTTVAVAITELMKKLETSDN